MKRAGGGRGRNTKKYWRKGKLNEQNSCPPIKPKKYTCCGLKTIHTRNLMTKKNYKKQLKSCISRGAVGQS